jgi:hypothetical protein
MILIHMLLSWLVVGGSSVAILAATIQEQTTMCVAGLIAAVAAILWGLALFCLEYDEQPIALTSADVDDEPRWRLGDYHYCDAYCDHWGIPGDADFEDELPYRPTWPNGIGGVE